MRHSESVRSPRTQCCLLQKGSLEAKLNSSVKNCQHSLGTTASGLFLTSRTRRFVRMQISVHPLCDEAIVLMANKNLWGMIALSVLFGQLYCSAERLSFAWESCCHRAMSISDLPLTILARHDVSRFMHASSYMASHNFRSLRKATRGFAAGSVAMEPTGRRTD